MSTGGGRSNWSGSPSEASSGVMLVTAGGDSRHQIWAFGLTRSPSKQLRRARRSRGLARVGDRESITVKV